MIIKALKKYVNSTGAHVLPFVNSTILSKPPLPAETAG
jgi:hypothetical protein